jgi:Ca-activated chloride channel homolog
MKMKIKGNILISIMLVVLFVALMIPAIRFIRNNDISKANQLKRKAKNEYLATEYVSAYNSYKLLIDSLGVANDAATLNYGNSAYLSSQLLTKGLRDRSRMDQNAPTDTALMQIGSYGREKFAMLTSSPIEKIASMASNQLGYASLKGTDVFGEKGGDSILFSALDHFKNALRKDPLNDSARYNYELVKMIIDFPETVLAETKALIAQKKYRAAAALLERGMKRDPRLRQQKDFMTRLRTVIAIDSLKGKGS